VLGLLVAIRELAVRGAPVREVRAARRLRIRLIHDCASGPVSRAAAGVGSPVSRLSV